MPTVPSSTGSGNAAERRRISLLQHALYYASLGWAVFPVRQDKKIPEGSLVPSGVHDATTSPDTIHEWWGSSRQLHNIGIATGAPSGLYVVDVDAGPEKRGAESYRALCDDNGGHVPTYTVRTPSGGWHFYYRADVELKNSAGKLGEHIDTRGHGGYVVAPPSTVDGRPYELVGPDTNSPHTPGEPWIAPLPDWMIDKLRKLTPTQQTIPAQYAPPAGDPLTPASVILHPHADVLARVQKHAAELRDAPDGTGNATAARVAAYCGQYVAAGQVDWGTCRAHLVDAMASWTWRGPEDHKRMVDTIELQLNWGMNNPRPQSAASATHRSADEPDWASPDPQTRATSTWATDAGQASWLMGRTSWTEGALPQWLIYVLGVGWHVWAPPHWRFVDEDRVWQYVIDHYTAAVARDQRKREQLAAEGTSSPLTAMRLQELDRRMRYLNSRLGAGRLSAIITVMRRTRPLDATDLDRDAWALNTPQGIVDLRTGEVRPSDPAKYMTKATAGSYRPGYTHPDWEQALTACADGETREYLQLRLGQAIVGKTPPSGDVLFLLGDGANGKSLMAGDGAKRAVGSYAMTADRNLIVGAARGGASPERARLRGARYVLLEELPEGTALNVEEIKGITDVDTITARELYKAAIEFPASHTLFVTSNPLPPVAETDHGTWRRLCPIPFPHMFVQNPILPHHRQGDPGLKLRLRDGTDGQHDAIVTWLVEGAIRFHHDEDAILPDHRPASVKAKLDQWQGASDKFLAYLTERLESGPEQCVIVRDLVTDFLAWLERHGHHAMADKTVITRMEAHETFKALCLGKAQVASTSLQPGAISQPRDPHGDALRLSGKLTDLTRLPGRVRVYQGLRFWAQD